MGSRARRKAVRSLPACLLLLLVVVPGNGPDAVLLLGLALVLLPPLADLGGLELLRLRELLSLLGVREARRGFFLVRHHPGPELRVDRLEILREEGRPRELADEDVEAVVAERPGLDVEAIDQRRDDLGAVQILRDCNALLRELLVDQLVVLTTLGEAPPAPHLLLDIPELRHADPVELLDRDARESVRQVVGERAQRPVDVEVPPAVLEPLDEGLDPGVVAAVRERRRRLARDLDGQLGRSRGLLEGGDRLLVLEVTEVT